MQLRNKTPKRRVKAKLRVDRAAAVGPNNVWAMDFVHDQLARSRKIRILTVVDNWIQLRGNVTMNTRRATASGMATCLNADAVLQRAESWVAEQEEER